jgi:oligoribonuclease NrnB/cAMP/cGMP phosphodiesterase (DHH superfamily)
MIKPLVVYHGPSCLDGMAAAWVAWDHFRDDAEYVVGKYQEDMGDIFFGRDVYLLDFSLKRDKMMQALLIARSVTVLDHHKSALEDLEGLDSMFENFSISDSTLDHSGAVITWKYFHDKKPVPSLLSHIEDRDLWRFRMDGTREVTAALFAKDLTFQDIGDFVKTHEVEKLYNEGVLLLSVHNKQVNLCIKTCYREVALNIGGVLYYKVPFINCPPNLTSDVGNTLAAKHPFVMTYYDSADYRNFSLRSSKECMTYKDVSELCKNFGGGGHLHAAGFKVDRNHWLAKM